jgi:hypothetical protein
MKILLEEEFLTGSSAIFNARYGGKNKMVKHQNFTCDAPFLGFFILQIPLHDILKR